MSLIIRNLHLNVLQNNTQVPAHKVPNICIGRFGVRRQVRLFFPQLYRADQPPAITQEDIAAIYNTGILPSIKEILPEAAAHWPPSYTTELIRAADRRGQIRAGTVDIPEDKVPAFATALRTRLRAHPRLGKPWFQVEMRGEKGAYSFPFDDIDERNRAFNLFIEDLNMSQINQELWFVDIGLEIHHPGHCVQWLKSAHTRLIAHALPSIPPDRAAEIADLSTFHIDVNAHIYDFAGFRVEPGARARPDKLLYMNIYTTDKTVTYQLHDGIFNPRAASDLYPGTLPKLVADLQKIGDTFCVCAGSEGHTQDGTARYELRVRLSKIHETLLEFPPELLELSVISIPNEIMWYVHFLSIMSKYCLRVF